MYSSSRTLRNINLMISSVQRRQTLYCSVHHGRNLNGRGSGIGICRFRFFFFHPSPHLLLALYFTPTHAASWHCASRRARLLLALCFTPRSPPLGIVLHATLAASWHCASRRARRPRTAFSPPLLHRVKFRHIFCTFFYKISRFFRVFSRFFRIIFSFFRILFGFFPRAFARFFCFFEKLYNNCKQTLKGMAIRTRLCYNVKLI